MSNTNWRCAQLTDLPHRSVERPGQEERVWFEKRERRGERGRGRQLERVPRPAAAADAGKTQKKTLLGPTESLGSYVTWLDVPSRLDAAHYLTI